MKNNKGEIMQIFKSIDSEIKYRRFVKLLCSNVSKKNICNDLDIHEQTFYKYFNIAKSLKHVDYNKYAMTSLFVEYEKEISSKLNGILIDNPYNEGE